MRDAHGRFAKGNQGRPAGAKNHRKTKLLETNRVHDMFCEITEGREYYVYIHVHEGEVFYVGKGKGNRAWSKSRTDHWREYIPKRYEVRIVAFGLTEKEALDIEAVLIKSRNPRCNQHGLRWNYGKMYALAFPEEPKRCLPCYTSVSLQ